MNSSSVHEVDSYTEGVQRHYSERTIVSLVVCRVGCPDVENNIQLSPFEVGETSGRWSFNGVGGEGVKLNPPSATASVIATLPDHRSIHACSQSSGSKIP